MVDLAPTPGAASAKMTFHGGKRTRRPPRGGTIAALDVGTTKICCVVGKVDEGGQIRLTGVGHQLSRGLRAGPVVDMEAAEQAIGTAVHAAERMAGETIHDVVVNISGGQPTSQLLNAKVPIGGHEVCDGDLRRALGQARQFLGSPEVELIHSIPVGYAIDG